MGGEGQKFSARVRASRRRRGSDGDVAAAHKEFGDLVPQPGDFDPGDPAATGGGGPGLGPGAVRVRQELPLQREGRGGHLQEGVGGVAISAASLDHLGDAGPVHGACVRLPLVGVDEGENRVSVPLRVLLALENQHARAVRDDGPIGRARRRQGGRVDGLRAHVDGADDRTIDVARAQRARGEFESAQAR
jgi:hypothetical protein